jgi:anti-sigma regulatory factor (Ser/Thr protein kinase)
MAGTKQNDSTDKHLRILSRTDWVEPVAMFLRKTAVESGVCDDAAATRLVVSMTEAITNAIVHGNLEISSELKQKGDDSFRKALAERQQNPELSSRVVDIRVAYEPDRCTWTITDQGNGFDVQKALARLESDDPMEILASGRGISIMKAFVDEVSWSEGGRQIHLSIFLDKTPERRTAERSCYTATIGVHPADGQMHEAIGRDLSETGIAFVTSTALRPGVDVTVTLDLRQTTEQFVTGKIVRCNPIAPPYFDAAVHFDQPIDVESVSD